MFRLEALTLGMGSSSWCGWVVAAAEEGKVLRDEGPLPLPEAFIDWLYNWKDYSLRMHMNKDTFESSLGRKEWKGDKGEGGGSCFHRFLVGIGTN